jgi:serine/threonine-protein kinase
VSIVVAAPSELWLKELPDGPLTRLTTDPGETRRPAWSADGSTIAYITQDPGARSHARTVRADGGSVGAYEVLLEREEAVLEVLFTPDGGALVFRTGDVGQGEADLGFVDLATGAVDEELLASDFNESAIDVSPDGRWLAYVSDLTGRPEVFVRPLASSQGGRRQVSTNGGFEPLWAANGREIFYREPVGGSMLVASYETDPTFSIEGRARLFDATPYALVNGWRGYDVSRDAQRFVMIRPDEVPDAGSSRLILVQNWFTELQERTRASR